LDLVPLPTFFDFFFHKERVSKSNFVKDLHEKIRQQIQHQTERDIKYNIKERREVIFNEGDLV